jgi:hypothetical protein
METHMSAKAAPAATDWWRTAPFVATRRVNYDGWYDPGAYCRPRGLVGDRALFADDSRWFARCYDPPEAREGWPCQCGLVFQAEWALENHQRLRPDCVADSAHAAAAAKSLADQLAAAEADHLQATAEYDRVDGLITLRSAELGDLLAELPGAARLADTELLQSLQGRRAALEAQVAQLRRDRATWRVKRDESYRLAFELGRRK